MENIIWILILMAIIQKILARAGRNTRFPGPVGRIPGDFETGKDEPLPGPWNGPAEQETVEDAPLPGPWNRQSGGKAEAPGERENTNREIPETHNREIAIPKETVLAQDIPEADRPSQVPAQSQDNQSQEAKERPGKRPSRRKTAPPLYRYFNNRHGLAASVIMSEVINRRGGRRR